MVFVAGSIVIEYQCYLWRIFALQEPGGIDGAAVF
jgi:hypothetical protein